MCLRLFHIYFVQHHANPKETNQECVTFTSKLRLETKLYFVCLFFFFFKNIKIESAQISLQHAPNVPMCCFRYN